MGPSIPSDLRWITAEGMGTGRAVGSNKTETGRVNGQ